ncbi:MAG: cell wall metabolism sensor histidine kinase WalK [Candidatus Obscuribacterales bacterium]|nr:cell wall metabolism sensor histidine kinase WalK [Candidatus Obscuribacterales bacterium]
MGPLQKIYNWLSQTLANQLLVTYLMVIAIALAVVTFWALLSIKSESIRDLSNSLEVEAVHLALEIDNDLALDSESARRRIQAAADRHAEKLRVAITVVDRNGHVLAEAGETPPTEDPKSIANEPEINDALAGIMGLYQRHSGRSRAEWLFVAYPVRFSLETSGVIRVGVPLTQLNQRLNQDLIVFLEIIAGTLVSTAFISIWIARRVTRPIRDMSELSREIAKSGDIHAFVPVERKDEIGELATSFNQMIDRLREEERMRQEFISNASHELKTPTMAIGSVVEALQAGAAEDPELRKKFLGSLENLVERQTSLLRDLLDVAQLDSTAKQQWLAEVNLADTVQDAIDQVRHSAERKNVELDVRVLNDGLVIVGNAIQLQRAITNLLSNAVNYTPAHGRVTIGSNRIDNHFVEVRIEDTGTGIDAKDLPHIFERFYRTDKARSRQSGGTGLGLAITREIVARHHGVIRVESTPGKGSIFTVTLPLKPVFDNQTSTSPLRAQS